MLNFLQEFPEAVFLGVTLKLLLDTPRVWTGQITDQTRVPVLMVSKTFDSIIGSCLNFYRSF